MSKNISSLSSRQGIENNLFDRLVEKGEATGTVSDQDIQSLATEFLLGEGSVLSAASFYDFLKRENQGKKAYVCNGTACLVAGTQKELKENLKSQFKEDELGEICCLGRCHEAGAFQAGGINYSGLKTKDFKDFKNHTKSGREEYPIKSNLKDPLLTGKFKGYDLLENVLAQTPDSLLQEIKDSQLRGRGGAGFPAGIKWETCKNFSSDKKFIVCNADEGDPGAYTDRYLLEEQPELVLFGMMIAGYICGADTGILYIRMEYPDSLRIINDAVKKLEDSAWLGENICGSGFNFRFKVIKGAGAYICGEETALLASLEGQRPEVRVRPPFPAESGLFLKPTIVNNVETFAFIYNILEKGGANFAKVGTAKSTGSKLVSLDSTFNTPGVYEVEMGTALNVVINEFGGGFKIPVKAIQVGGPLGGVIPDHMFDSLTIDFESFKEGGFLLGHAGIVGIPESFSMAEYIEHLFEFTAAESCGKCFPCRLGSVRGQELMEKSRHENYKIDPELMNDLLEALEETSLCALGGGVPLPIKNILHYFEPELEEFFIQKEKS
ncbi:MAG: formate dehydrogenase [Planctomycetota bacterium]|nr:MAG: formate dehydrogenase [Planctomycetota bacterium]